MVLHHGYRSDPDRAFRPFPVEVRRPTVPRRVWNGLAQTATA
jgi:hypothetical protein